MLSRCKVPEMKCGNKIDLKFVHFLFFRKTESPMYTFFFTQNLNQVVNEFWIATKFVEQKDHKIRIFLCSKFDGKEIRIVPIGNTQFIHMHTTKESNYKTEIESVINIFKRFRTAIRNAYHKLTIF